MEIKSYRARSVQEALAMVRAELGPDAAVLHTREVQGGMLRWLGGARQIEVIATADAQSVPSRRLPDPVAPSPTESTRLPPPAAPLPVPPPFSPPRERESSFRHRLAASATGGLELSQFAASAPGEDAFARLRKHLVARQWPRATVAARLEELEQRCTTQERESDRLLRGRLARLIEESLPPCRPLRLAARARSVVALVGPTGVGKTTTVAKLAASFRLKQQRKVGLITVDTYRIAAVEQLRTYADILDVPMEVVATPREMRSAVERMAQHDLVLIDTAGRSPRDQVRLQELRAMLAEAQPDEVQLVLSTVASGESLVRTVEQFAPVGVTALMLTKLDEAHGLGQLLPLAASSSLPISYVTHGQNVPDDIAPADRRHLAQAIVELPTELSHA